MSSLPTRNPTQDHLVTPENSVLLLIDYQPIQVASIASMARREMVSNIVTVAKAAKLFKIPIVLSTVRVKMGMSPTIPQLKEVLPAAEELDRTQINAWEDKEFVQAVKATQRKKLLMAGLWTEACLTFPTLDALREGFEVYPLADCVGGTSEAAHKLALKRVIQAGAKPMSWVQLLCELQRDWIREETSHDFAKLLFTVEGH